MKKYEILIIENDDDFRHTLTQQLKLYNEFNITEQNNALNAIDIAKEKQIDLIIMDTELPDINGTEIIKILRKKEFKAPIIILTKQNTDNDTILGLDAGANDYMIKPIKISVLMARIRAQLRQHIKSEDVIYKIGPHVFYPAQKIIKIDKKEIRLTEKETNILKYLYRAEQKCVPRGDILRDVWGYNKNIATHTLETHIYRIRKKIEIDPAKAKYLSTCNGGYKLVI